MATINELSDDDLRERMGDATAIEADRFRVAATTRGLDNTPTDQIAADVWGELLIAALDGDA